MPEATILVEKVTTKEGTGKKGPWTRYGIKAVDGEWFNTFNEAQGKLAQEYEGTGAMFRATYDVGKYGNDLTELAGPVTNGDAPPQKSEDKPALGTGTYIKGKENPATQRSIAAAVALREAVATMSHTIDRNMTPKEASERVEPLAASYFNFLIAKAGLMDEDSIPF